MLLHFHQQYRRYTSSLLAVGFSVGYVTTALAQVPANIQQPVSLDNNQQAPLNPSASPGGEGVTPSSYPVIPRVQQQEDAYVLGPGDVIRFDIFNVPELTNANSTNRLVVDNLYNVLVDGTLNLPWIGRVYVQGLDLEEAASAIESRYTEFILDPVVTLTLFTPRPVRIAVVGEVERPGAYTTGELGTPNDPQATVGELRTVIDAIQTAGGITQMADIRNIQVVRPQPGGADKVIPVDFWALLKEGDQQENILLRDGDSVIIPTATAIMTDELATLADANFSPDTINVNVVGEVDAPGTLDLPPNPSLNEAIMAAGGFDDPRADTGEVALIRLNPNGTVINRRIPVNLADGINEETNPVLRKDDIVIVSRSNVTAASDFLELVGGAASAVINPIFGLFGIIDVLNGNGN